MIKSIIKKIKIKETKLLNFGHKIIENRYNKNSNKSYYKNREKVIKRNIEYERKKLKTDMRLVLKKRLRNRLHQVLKGITNLKAQWNF
jgi:hypothetical protein